MIVASESSKEYTERTRDRETKFGKVGTNWSRAGNTVQKYAGRFRQMNPLTTLTDGGLSQKARRGDAEAFGEIYRRHSRKIYRFSLHMSGNPLVAEEVTQEVFMALLRGEGSYDATKGELEPFLIGVARNQVRRYQRTQPMEELSAQDEPAIPDASVLEDLTRKESLQRLQEAILSLPANYREVVVLCELEEMSYEQAAAALGCPLGTVRSRLSRARTMLVLKLTGMGNSKLRCLA